MKNCKPVDKHFIIKQHMVTYPISANGIIALAKLTTFKYYFSNWNQPKNKTEALLYDSKSNAY